jgi:hypothetical protein
MREGMGNGGMYWFVPVAVIDAPGTICRLAAASPGRARRESESSILESKTEYVQEIYPPKNQNRIWMTPP